MAVARAEAQICPQAWNLPYARGGSLKKKKKKKKKNPKNHT